MPERWLDKSVPEHAWLPFGTGQRQCVGIKFAMQDMKVCLQGVHASKQEAHRLFLIDAVAEVHRPPSVAHAVDMHNH